MERILPEGLHSFLENANAVNAFALKRIPDLEIVDRDALHHSVIEVALKF
jgi:hypothetical protein